MITFCIILLIIGYIIPVLIIWDLCRVEMYLVPKSILRLFGEFIMSIVPIINVFLLADCCDKATKVEKENYMKHSYFAFIFKEYRLYEKEN